MKGTVKQAHTGNPNNPNLKPNKYTIKGEDGKEYIAHIGDIQKNEEKLYQLDKEGNTFCIFWAKFISNVARVIRLSSLSIFCKRNSSFFWIEDVLWVM